MTPGSGLRWQNHLRHQHMQQVLESALESMGPGQSRITLAQEGKGGFGYSLNELKPTMRQTFHLHIWMGTRALTPDLNQIHSGEIW